MTLRAWSLAVLCTLAVLMAGCGGGGGGGPTEPVGVSVSVGADAACLDDRGDSTRQMIGAPLDAGAKVTAYDFATRVQIATGKTGSSGYCNLRITPGLTVAIVVIGQNAGKTYRLSTIIPMVSIGGGEFIADPATSLAAEAIAQKHYGKTALDQDTLDAVLGVALQCVHQRPGADWSLAGGLILGSEFGAQGSLNLGELQDVIDAVPAIINSKMVAAKNCVRQVREAGAPLASMLGQERPDIEGIFAGTVGRRYEDLISRLHVLMLPAMFGGMEYENPEGDLIWPTVFDLEIGKGYKAESRDDGMGCSWLALTDDPSQNAAGRVTITYTVPSGTYRLVATQSASTWTVTQTFTGDSSQIYTVTLPNPADDPGENPSLVVAVNLRDSMITTPLTFQGKVSAVGTDRGTYTRITLDGVLSSPEVSAQGKFQADFAPSVPVGADADAYDIYDFPTCFTMTGAKVTAKIGSQTISMTGTLSLLLQPFAVSGRPKLVPKHLDWTGGYSNKHSGLAFTGSIAGDWTNPAPDGFSAANGSVHLHGELSRSGYPAYYADIVFSAQAGSSIATIDLRAGNGSLKGTATATLGTEVASLTLTNQAGVEIVLSSDATGRVTGRITVLSEKVADITEYGDALRVTYHTTPVTYDEFPL